MNKFVRSLLTEWRRLELPFNNETIVVAVSGGADSTSLVFALNELKQRKKLDLNFVIAHFNHNLRGRESESDSQFVKALASELKFEIETGTGDIRPNGNLEQNARIARYEFLGQVATRRDAFGILLAHTKNDQAETLLLNLIRGCGLDGLAGMPSVRDTETTGSQLPKGRLERHHRRSKIIRPLLSWSTREDTESFCLENKIEFRQDAMNDDLEYSRVRIRKEIIPLLQKINPRVVDSLSKTANILREEAAELSNVSLPLSKHIVQKTFKLLSKSMRVRVLRDWLKQRRGHLRQIDSKHLEAIDRLIFSRKSGNFVELPGGEKVIKRDGKIDFENSRVEKS